MKRSILTVSATMLVVVITLASCGKSSKAYQDLKKDYDSVATVYQTQISETDSILGLIISNFQEINAMEGVIDVDALKGDVGKSQRARIEDNVRMINERLKSNREEIARLNDKLKASGSQSSGLRKTVSALESQLNEKTKEVLRLSKELQRKDMAITILDSMVTDLNKNVQENTQTISSQQETIAKQDAAIHTVHYCVGTMGDLKEMNIVKGGKVATDDFTSDYFRQVDMRSFNNLALYAKRAELLTNHPKESYMLRTGEDKMLTLEISDPEKFWSLSKVLVVRTY